MAKPEKFDHLYLVHNFTAPLCLVVTKRSHILKQTCSWKHIKNEKKSVPPLGYAVDKIKSYAGHKSNYMFLSTNHPQDHPRLFVQFDSEHANVLSNKYFFNLGTAAQYFSVSCIGFGTSLYSVVVYLIKCDSQFSPLLSVNLMVSVAVPNSPLFSLIVIWTFDGILLFERPLNIIFKTVKSILSGTSHFSGTTSSFKQNLPFTKLGRDFCSFIILRTWYWGSSMKRLLQ